MSVDGCPCFNLGLAHRRVLRAYEDALAPLALTVAKAHALSVLFRHDGALSRDLARELSIDAGTLTPLIDRLEKQGLLTRCPHPDDRRASRLCLTEQAHRLRPSIEAAGPGRSADWRRVSPWLGISHQVSLCVYCARGMRGMDRRPRRTRSLRVHSGRGHGGRCRSPDAGESERGSWASFDRAGIQCSADDARRRLVVTVQHHIHSNCGSGHRG